MPEKVEGVIVNWNEERGFGFIKEPITGVEIFAHISAFNVQNPIPRIGEKVIFVSEFDEKKGKSRASNISYVDRKLIIRILDDEPTSEAKTSVSHTRRKKKSQSKRDKNLRRPVFHYLILWMLVFAIVLIALY